VKRILLVGALAFVSLAPAFAADLPPPAPVPYVPVVRTFSWSGFYLGANVGYGFGQSTWTSALGTVGGFATDGGLAGITVGGNYQWGQFVVGIEGDVDWQNLRGSQTTGPCAIVGVGSCATASNWISTLRGRAGFAVNRALVYATGGAAFTTVKPSTGALPYGGGNEPGWTAGAGVEFAMTDNWTVKLEYLFADFEHATCPVSSCAAAAPATVSFNENIVRVGANYLFNY
jgi:outer membrane immunogenic protein